MRLPSPPERSLASAANRAQERHSHDDEEARTSSYYPAAQGESTSVKSAEGERTALLANMDRREERFYKLRPCESIYSFFMFMPAVEYRSTGRRCNYILGFAIGLVCLNIMMQSGLMFVVSRDSMRREDAVVTHLIPTTPPWYQVHKRLLAPAAGVAAGCVSEKSLCMKDGDKISCAPKSVRLLQHWELLDTNGDGIWSRTEAENKTHRADMQCRFGSDTLALYGQMTRDLQAQPSLTGRLLGSVVEGNSIHRAYFDWYLGEPLLCLHIDEDSCGNMFEKGVFDEAIRTGAPFKPKINDLQSARGYCTDLLRNRCEQILPSSYHTWKLDALEMCGSKEFTTVAYNSPDQDPNNVVNKVTYSRLEEYQKWRSWIFTGYLATLLLTFFSTLLAEWKDIYRTVLYCIQFPHLRGGANDGFQRFSVILVTLVRTVLWICVGYGGTIFLTSKTDYLGMIFDALSLAFIITIDELIYATMLRAPMKSAHQEIEALLLHRRKLWMSVHFWEAVMLLAVVAAAVCVACSYQTQELQPISQALECLCSSEGPTCQEASLHTKAYWDTFWTKTLPMASMQIDKLLAQGH